MLIYKILESKKEDIDYLERIGLIFKSNDDKYYVLEKHIENFKECLKLKKIDIFYKKRECLGIFKNEKSFYSQSCLLKNNKLSGLNIFILKEYKAIILYTHIGDLFRYVIVKDLDYNVLINTNESNYFSNSKLRHYINYSHYDEIKEYFIERLKECKNKTLFNLYVKTLIHNNIHIDLTEIDENKKNVVLCPDCYTPVYSHTDINKQVVICDNKHDFYNVNNKGYEIKKFFDFNFEKIFNENNFYLYNIHTKEIVINRNNVLINKSTGLPINIFSNLLKREWVCIPLAIVSQKKDYF